MSTLRNAYTHSDNNVQFRWNGVKITDFRRPELLPAAAKALIGLSRAPLNDDGSYSRPR